MAPPSLPHRRPLAAMAVAAVLLVGCGDDDDPVDTGTSTSRVDPLGSDDITDTTDVDVTTPTETESETTSEPDGEAAPTVDADRVIEVTVTGGTVDGGGRQQVALGESVALVVTSDTADEVHVHGYDLYADLVPGEPAVIEFTADIPGVFEAELHDAGSPLVELEIS